jgi:hypothetical protein
MRANMILAGEITKKSGQLHLAAAGPTLLGVTGTAPWSDISLLCILQMDSPTEAGEHELLIDLLNADLQPVVGGPWPYRKQFEVEQSNRSVTFTWNTSLPAQTGGEYVVSLKIDGSELTSYGCRVQVVR